MSRLALAVVIIAGFLAPRKEASASVTSDWRTEAMVVELGVLNEGQTTLVLDQVGVESKLIEGKFECKSAAMALPIIAHYHIDFLVASMYAKYGAIQITTKPANPPLSIPSQQVATFLVSVYPIESGRCGKWKSDARILLRFTNGTTLYSEWRTLTSDEVEALRVKTTPVDVVRSALCNPDRDVFKAWFEDAFMAQSQTQAAFIAALKKLSRVDLAVCTEPMWRDFQLWVVSFLDFDFDNNDTEYKITLARTGARFGFEAIIPILKKGIESSKDRNLTFGYCLAWKELNQASAKKRFDNLPRNCR